MQASIRHGAAFAAVAVPVLASLGAAPSPTLLNQCAGLGLMGGWAAVLAMRSGRPAVRDVAGLLIGAALVVGGLVAAHARGLPLSIAAGIAAAIAAFTVLVFVGNAAGRGNEASAWYADFAWALCWAGVISAVIGCIQVFAPGWPDGEWIARSTSPGRAVGNLRQPNHLASLELWALIAVVVLHELAARRRALMFAAGATCLLGVVLSGSRTGILGVLLLAGWGLLDRRFSRSARIGLCAMPVLFVGFWLAMAAWAHASAHTFGAEGRLLAEGGDISSSRFGIWSNTLALIAREPWTGLGLGEFNAAWTLTAFPDRPVAFFDHTHNLPLQFLVELGIPMGGAVIALLLMSLVQAGRRAWGAAGALGVAKRAAFMAVLMIGLHSLLEYPLWYLYFLLPTAFAWGFALACTPKPGNGSEGAASASREAPAEMSARRTLALAGVVMSIGAAAAALDYWSVVVIYDPPANAAPLEDRIARGQRSPLFGHHADYAAATAFGPPQAPLSPSQQLAFERAPHQLLDVRLMIAWSQALASQGDLDKARWLAARIREFRNPGADEYFAPCKDPAQAAQAFQCQPPTRVVHWREFVQR